jgi:hypothetical protein
VVKGRQRVQSQHEGTKDRVCGSDNITTILTSFQKTTKGTKKNQQQPPPPALPLFHLLRTSSFSFRRRWYPPVGSAQVVDLSVIFSRFLSFAVRSRPFSVFFFYRCTFRAGLGIFLNRMSRKKTRRRAGPGVFISG